MIRGRIRYLWPLLAILLLPALGRAGGEAPLTPAEFRAYAEGWTLYFEKDGEPFGAEAFRPGGETLWYDAESGECLRGQWRAYGAQICFYYGLGSEVLCWRFLKDEKGYLVRLLNTEEKGLTLRVSGRDKREPVCAGPSEPAAVPRRLPAPPPALRASGSR